MLSFFCVYYMILFLVNLSFAQNCPWEQRTTFHDANKKHAYCDRIITTSNALVSSYYTAITNDEIDKSDHDLVIGYVEYKGMKVLIITWNMEDFGKAYTKTTDTTQREQMLKDIICSIQSKLAHDRKPKLSTMDIFFFAFQEALKLKAPYDDFRKDLKKALDKAPVKSGGNWQFDKDYAAEQVVYSFIYYNKKTIEYNKKRHVKDVSFKGYNSNRNGGRKAFILIGKFRAKNKKKESDYIVLGNAHLPFDTNNFYPEWGLENRQIALDLVHTRFKEKFPEVSGKRPLLLLAGDLNFRIVNNKDQLTQYMDAKKDGTKKIWYEINKYTAFKETCKKEMGTWSKEQECSNNNVNEKCLTKCHESGDADWCNTEGNGLRKPATNGREIKCENKKKKQYECQWEISKYKHPFCSDGASSAERCWSKCKIAPPANVRPKPNRCKEIRMKYVYETRKAGKGKVKKRCFEKHWGYAGEKGFMYLCEKAAAQPANAYFFDYVTNGPFAVNTDYYAIYMILILVLICLSVFLIYVSWTFVFCLVIGYFTKQSLDKTNKINDTEYETA